MRSIIQEKNFEKDEIWYDNKNERTGIAGKPCGITLGRYQCFYYLTGQCPHDDEYQKEDGKGQKAFSQFAFLPSFSEGIESGHCMYMKYEEFDHVN